jgi:hypothetical protein
LEEIGVVIETTCGIPGWVRIKFPTCSNTFKIKDLQIVSASVKQTNKGGLIMSLVKSIKELTLSTDDRLLRKYGVVTETGDLTETGESLLILKALETYKDAIVADLKALEAAEKKVAK